jgi:hypothetical protein
MIHPDIATAIAQERQRDLRRGAADSRIARLTRCCRRSFLAARVRSVSAPWAEVTRGRSAACCA